MSQVETIQTPQDYVNYTFNIEARGVAEVSSELMGLSNTVGNILGQLAFKTSEFLTHTESLAMGTGLAISGMFVSATKDAINFQQQIANVQAIGGETINAGAIGDAAMEYSNKFGMATASMTEGLEALARAGITSTDVMKEVLAEGVKLSKLEGMDLEDSINDLISTTNLLAESGVDMNDPNYGKLVQEMNQHIVSTSESAPINAQNIIQSLQHVGGYASASGMDQDDLFAVIAQLGARGTKGEMAGTALRAFIAAGQKDTAQRALARVGLNVSDLWNDNGETMLSISEMKNVLDEALEARGYSKQEKLEFYSDFVGYKQANQIMKIDTAEVEKYKDSIANAWDLGKKLDTILGTVRGNLDRIWQITQNFMTRVGSQLLTIAGVILEPVRALLEFVTALPGADTAVAVGMIFVAFRTGLMIFNKLVPAVSGFMSGLSDARNETKGFRGEWQKTRDEIQKTKEIIDLIKHGDQEGLAERHYREHGLSAKNKMGAERNIAGQMYMASDWYKENGRIKWDDLEDAAKDMIVERFKPTQAFKDNYEYYVESIRQATNQIVMNPVNLSEVNIEEEPIEAINVHVAQIFDLLKSDRTIGTSDAPESNLERNAQANIISQIMNNANIRPEKYGNYEFDFRDAEKGFDELKKATEKAYRDLERKVEKFSNTSFTDISDEQKNTYRKILYREAMTPEGKKYSARANESEVRFALDRGRFEKEDVKWYQGIKDSQIREMGRLAGIDMSGFNKTTQNNDQRQEYISQIHDALNQKSADERKRITEAIVQETNKKWKEEVTDKDVLTIDPANVLRNNENIAKQITQALNIGVQNNDYAKAVHSFFEKEENRNDTKMVDTATQIIFDNLKQSDKFTLPEQRELRYTIENLQRLRNTFQYFSDNNMHEDFRDEMGQIIEGMTVYNSLFRKGGAELGEALVQGFVVEGLGIHSPGYMFWALVDEQTNINQAILQSRGMFNKNASLLGLELTNAFDSSLGIDRVFDSGIEFIRRDTDVIKDIIDGFDRDAFRTDDEIDLPYDLLPSQIDAQEDLIYNSKAIQDFAAPYGFDVSNYQRFGTNFGASFNSIAPFKSIIHFANSMDEFDFEDMFNSGLFDEDDIYTYMDTIRHAFHEDTSWSSFKTTNDTDIDDSVFDDMNQYIEDYYFSFLATMSQEMTNTIKQTPGLVDNVLLYRGGRLPITSEGLGEYLGSTSTSYAKRIGDIYTAMNSAVNETTNVYAPEDVLGLYLNRQQFGSRRIVSGQETGKVFDNQIEYLLGSGQPFIELPNQETGRLSGKALRTKPDVLLLTPDQIEEVQGVVVDEVASMINSGRTDSNILNLSGTQIANQLMNEKYDIGAVNNISSSNKYDAVWGHNSHNTPEGMLYDAAAYIRKTQNKRVFDFDEFFSLIESINGEEAAEQAKDVLNNAYSQGVIKDNGKIKLPALMNKIAKGHYSFRSHHGTSLDQYQVVTPRQVFDLIQKHPEIQNELTKTLNPYVDARMGEQPTREAFEQMGYMDDNFVILPYEYSWLLGGKTADDLVSTIDSNPYTYGHEPTTSLDKATQIWDQLGPDAILNHTNLYDDKTIEPTVENSFERMMMGLAYGFLDDKSSPNGVQNDSGIHLYPHITQGQGAIQTLNTLIHEFTHMGLNQKYRNNLDESNPLSLPTFTSNETNAKTGYKNSYKYIGDEFETNWVVSQVFAKNGIPVDDGDKYSTMGRVKGFYEIFKDQGYESHLQWELYDEWINNISENIDKFIDIGEAFDKKYSDLSAAEISQKWDAVRKMVNANRDTSQPFGMPGVMVDPSVDYHAINKRQEEIAALRKQMAEDEARWAEEGVQYATEKRKQLEELRKKQKAQYQMTREIQEQMATGQLEYLTHYQNRGGVPNAPEDTSQTRTSNENEDEYRDRINQEMATKYPGLFPDMDNKFNQARYNVNKDGQGNQRIMSAIDWVEKIQGKVHDKAFSAASGIADKYNDEETQQHIQRINAARDSIKKIATPLQSFNDGLSRAAEIFPILSPLVWGLDTALWGLNMVSSILEFTETLLSVSKIQDILASWGLFTAEEAEAIAKGEATLATWLLTGAIGGLEAIMSGPLLIVIAAVIAILAVVYLSEKHHAEALKEINKALEENNKSMKASLANYKSMHQARLSAVDAGRRHIAALKESIALKKLETERYDRLNNIEKKRRLDNDPIWGETNSTRTAIQNGAAQWIPGVGSLITKFLAGDYEATADKHADNQYQLRTIVDLDQTSGTLTPENILKNIWEGYDSSYASDVNYYYKQHTREFAQMDAFAPQLEELYKIETQAQRIYGKEGARDSDMFKRALQDVANETGLNGETLGHYLDYMQVEANVENARAMATSGFGEVQAQIQAEAMSKLYPDGNNMGDLDSLQDTMVKAMVEDEARKAKRELFESAVLEYMQALYSISRLDFDNAGKHFDAANTYLGGMQQIDENKEKILQDSLDVAEEGLRKDYGTGAYSIYGDTPFGGAVESAHAAGLSVPNYSSNQSNNSSITSSSTTSNINKATSNAQTAVNTAKEVASKVKTQAQTAKSEESSGWNWGEIAKSAVSGALDFAKKYDPLVGAISAFFPDDSKNDVQPTVNKYDIHVETININTEDDPEKIKTALMNLMIEMQEQITPRQVSRTIGSTSSSTENITEGTDDKQNQQQNPNASGG